MATTIEIEDMITVGDLAEKLALPATTLIMELMKNGVMATVNESIDFDTAEIIVGELDLDIELAKKEVETSAVRERPKASDKATQRPPVVAVMGHVDHGKTTLLDAIRSSKKVESEAGGITQHISAYQISHNDRKITFLDTPGHEAFAALREHGARLTDLAVLVVAADDGIKPQTVEAIRFARKAGVKILVAINKIDKPGADENRVKQQLSEHKLLVEEWGGDTVTVNVSALKKTGISELLDMILLMADVEDLKADEDVPASGLIIETHMERGRGAVANALVEAGTLKVGDYIVAGSTYAKVRNLETTEGKALDGAGPSTPVRITGFKDLPAFADEFKVVATEKEARNASKKAGESGKSGTGRVSISSSEFMRRLDRKRQSSDLNAVVKADVQGSLTSVIDSLKSLETEEVAVKVVASGVGDINENDLQIARGGSAVIYGFNVKIPTSVKQVAHRDKITIRLFDVIYELIDDAKKEMSELLAPEIVETELGTLIVRGVFKISRTDVICGGEVTKGKLTVPALVRITRDGEEIAEAEAANLKRGPQDAKEIIEGEMCGVGLKTESKVAVKEGDRLEFFTRETVSRSL